MCDILQQWYSFRACGPSHGCDDGSVGESALLGGGAPKRTEFLRFSDGIGGGTLEKREGSKGRGEWMDGKGCEERGEGG